MQIRQFLRFPGFLDKAVTLSYDDGVIYDVTLGEIVTKYNMKCTFNINSGRFPKEGDTKSRVMKKEDALKFYKHPNFEVAIHGAEHLSLASIPEEFAVRDILLDRIELEKLFGRVVKGMAYANGSVDDAVVDLLKKCGVEYARTVKDTEKYDIPADFLQWHPTAHHTNPNLMELAEAFLHKNEGVSYYWRIVPRIFYLWGHSYEFNDAHNWKVLEEFCQKMGNRENIWYATNGEICAYVKAYDSLRWSADGSMVQNPSSQDVYLDYFKKQILVKSGETAMLK